MLLMILAFRKESNKKKFRLFYLNPNADEFYSDLWLFLRNVTCITSDNGRFLYVIGAVAANVYENT